MSKGSPIAQTGPARPAEAGAFSRTWAARYKARHGRAPRVLHIGNIANNAYNNAKLMIAAGLECHVLCHDYYHCMGCPEWEDADFDVPPRNAFDPNWRDVDLRGFRRPDWFVQGPMIACLNYLSALNARDAQGMIHWRRLMGRPRARLPRWMGQWRPLLGKVPGVRPVFRAARRLVRSLLFVSPWAPRLCPEPGDKGFPRDDWDPRPGLIESFSREFPARDPKIVHRDFAHPFVRQALALLPLWRQVLRQYDIIQGYSTDPFWALLSGAPYFAFEHGTLREIPFRNDTIGRFAALSYRRARHIFVTNADCIENAHTLGGERVTFLNHPYDEDQALRIDGADALRAQWQRQLDCRLLVFFPTRQDWVPGTGYADKANDQFLRAFARLRAEGLPLGLICCRWGRNVRQSMALLKSLGCARAVTWVEPLGVVQFNRTVRACDVVADQFKLGAFGGVLFKAMANGACVCTYLEEAPLRRLYAEPPPVINCRLEEEIVGALRPYLRDAGLLRDLSLRGRRWIEKYHAGADTVDRQVRQYARFLEHETAADGGGPGAVSQ